MVKGPEYLTGSLFSLERPGCIAIAALVEGVEACIPRSRSCCLISWPPRRSSPAHRCDAAVAGLSTVRGNLEGGVAGRLRPWH